ncbi:Panacea domain-containing protein [Pseudomonas koreensis]|jgi:uncharacterized phage-associated protein|uniref:Panacea domain-containing protein n=1 Tax=Pseudomonas koreensis TaxID=198620 RepID=UPI001B339DDD|nr:type II toxin-antitoxin system antitoxin SocA domain-containing protein [Pseudomonas koreensis]MBP4001564.1 DUF4065 domain-containing protein [Pseudomonas koreensis]
MFSAKSIANYFLELAQSSDQCLSSLKLQALVYYAHGWHTGYTGRALLNEKVQAGPYGLVIASLYREFNRFGTGPITRKALDYDAHGAQVTPSPKDKETQTLLRTVFQNYASYSDTQLTQMAHGKDTPWDITWRESKGMHGVNIPLSRITAYFKAAVHTAEQQADA